MNSDLATTAVVSPAGAPPRTLASPAALAEARRGGRARMSLDRLEPARAAAVRDSWRALWRSRLLVWAASVGAIVAFGYGPTRKAFDPPGVTRGFGWLGDLLAAPAARWDSAWYLTIAHSGYGAGAGAATAPRDAFFPLYPLALRAVGWLGVPPVPAGVSISLVALALALYGIHRLTTLELAGSTTPASDAARLAVAAMAFAPMAYYLSAVYSESLYLALSVGVLWSARHGRWRWVGVLGALAGATRSSGLALIVPVLLIYLYGPREDRPPDRARGAGWRGLLRTRYRVEREIAWLALLPAGMVLFCAYMALAGGQLLAPLHAEAAWGRHLELPLIGVWDGLRAGFDGARQLLSFQRSHVYYAASHGSPLVSAGHNLLDLAFLVAAVPALVGVLRRLPLAYGVYVLCALALPLSEPIAAEPLMSLPRYMVVLFPLGMWLGAWLAERPRMARPALVLSALAMAFLAVQFATWHWVA